MSAKSTKKKPVSKDFPLFQHPRGYWAKKVKQQTRYFGKVADDPTGQKALALWLDQKDDLLAGRTPRVHRDGLTVRDLCNRFLTNKQAKMEGGELSAVTFHDHHATCTVSWPPSDLTA